MMMSAKKIKSLKKLLKRCPGCGAAPGQLHHPGCDVERCSVCGNQHIMCRCKGHDPAFARWTGIWPGDAEAKYLGIDLNELQLSGIYRVLFIKPKGEICTIYE